MNHVSLELSNQINIKYSEIHNKQDEIDMIKQEITQLKKNLFITCTHEWINDSDDRSCHSISVCKHCKLYRNPNYN
jgi:hypothetical protein